MDKLELESFLIENSNNTSTEALQKIINKYNNHPSIIQIKENVLNENDFTFKDMTTLDFEREILKLDTKNANLQGDIPAKIIIKTDDIISNYLRKYYNKAKQEHKYPTSLKMADVIPIHKKEEKTLAKSLNKSHNVVSKLFERNMYTEIIYFIENSLSPFLFGFRKGHSTEQRLVIMLEAWKKAVDDKGYAGAILTDLSKAFDYLNHDLLIAKLDAYGFSQDALKFIRSYLKERTKVGSAFCTWLEMKHGVSQGSILGPLIFNIFLSSIFYFINDICITNFADESETNILLEWLTINEMKPNADKCHLLVANLKDITSVKLGNEEITNDQSVELLGVKIDKNLNFSEHVTKLC